MHEFGIAEELLAAAEVEAARAGGGDLSVIGVRLGAGSGIDEDALRASFEALTSHRGLDHLTLHVEGVPHRRRCGCGAAFEAVGRIAVCPSCGGIASEPVGGTGLEISFLEFLGGAD